MVDISYFAIANPTNETRNSLKIKNARFEVIHLDGLIVSIELDRAVYEIASFTIFGIISNQKQKVNTQINTYDP